MHIGAGAPALSRAAESVVAFDSAAGRASYGVVGDALTRPRDRSAELTVAGHRLAAQITLASAAMVVATAVWVRFTDLFQFGFNSDEAVYSGQAAAIAGFQPYAQLFGVFRAHPLLTQFIVALAYSMSGHVNDWMPRLISASFGVALALICWGIGMVLQGRSLGFAMGMIAALCPYAVLVSRQMLLDGPMATFIAATMLLMALWLTTRRVAWLYAASATAGLAMLTKEMAVLTLPSVALFALFVRGLPIRWWRDVPIVALVFAVVVSPYPLALLIGGGHHTTNQFLVWQFFRRPNHDSSFYLLVIPSLGFITVALASIGVASIPWRRHPFDGLALALLLSNVIFFEAWPTKGFEYLLPIVPSVVYLAGCGVLVVGELGGQVARRWRFQRLNLRRWGTATALALVLASLVPAPAGAVQRVQQQIATDSDDASDASLPAHGFLAGTGGLQASRPAGEWIRVNTLPSARFMTIGPSFANVIQFYGQRKALALSVSPNPLHRNPQYEPILNPDAAIRSGSIQYVVYDSYSATRTPFFASRLMAYVKKFGGSPIYQYRSGGASNQPPDVVIYEVHP